MKIFPTNFEIEQYKRKKRNRDIKVFGGVCITIIIVAAILLLIG